MIRGPARSERWHYPTEAGGGVWDGIKTANGKREANDTTRRPLPQVDFFFWREGSKLRSEK